MSNFVSKQLNILVFYEEKLKVEKYKANKICTKFKPISYLSKQYKEYHFFLVFLNLSFFNFLFNTLNKLLLEYLKTLPFQIIYIVEIKTNRHG